MSRKILFSGFNMYKGGSKAILMEMLAVHECDESITFLIPNSLRSNILSRYIDYLFIPYPISMLNSIYRLLVEHLFVPLLAMLFRVDRVVMLGNFPALFSFREQYVLFHNLLYIDDVKSQTTSNLLFKFEKLLFKALVLIKSPVMCVQTETVGRLLQSYFNGKCKILIVGTALDYDNELRSVDVNCKTLNEFFYPAFYYPHKNHSLLFSYNNILRDFGYKVSLTLDPIVTDFCNANIESFVFLGELTATEVTNLYSRHKALLFFSQTESLGLPLLEAASSNIPIIAPNLDYVRSVLKSNSFYSFDLHNPASFRAALLNYQNDKNQGTLLQPVLVIDVNRDSFFNRFVK